MSRLLIVAGVVLIVLGLSWNFIVKLPLGRLPGDIVIEKKSVSFYFPLMTSIVLSAVLSLLLWIFSKK